MSLYRVEAEGRAELAAAGVLYLAATGSLWTLLERGRLSEKRIGAAIFGLGLASLALWASAAVLAPESTLASVGLALSLVGAALAILETPVLGVVLIAGAASVAGLAASALGARALDWGLAIAALGASLAALRLGLTRAFRTAGQSAQDAVAKSQQQVADRYEQEIRALANPATQRLLDERGEMDGLWELTVHSGRVLLSPRWRGLLGYEPQAFRCSLEDWVNLVHPRERRRFQSRLLQHLKGETGTFECEHRVREASGDYRWVLSRGRVVADPNGKPMRIVGTQIDIARQKSYEAELYYQATHDRLTGVANRQHLMDQLQIEAQRAGERGGGRFAIAFFDLDGFKLINDTLGHDAGDEMLKGVGERLREAKREGDLVARLGGDEFVVLLRPVEDEPDAKRLVQRLLDALKAPMTVKGENISVTASVGVAVSSTDQRRGPNELLRDADIAMYHAKREGKAHSELFSGEMLARTAREFSLRNGLRTAFEAGHLDLYYQPISCSSTGRIVAAEALMRWRASDGLMVPPSEFIPLAEQSGLIHELGAWAIEEAALRAYEWKNAGVHDFRISVNLSPKQAASPHLVDRVSEILNRTKMEPGWLLLEITEGALLENHKLVLENIAGLYGLGVRVALDDFGSGYSSLSYLRELKCSYLKIDRSFVKDLERDEKSRVITQSIVGLAQSLNLAVVGEGVVTKDQLTFLIGNGCDYIQGYLVSRPLPRADFEKMILGKNAAVRSAPPKVLPLFRREVIRPAAVGA